jgi:excisionase family DNA binding protein
MAQPDPYLLTTGQAAKLCEVVPDTILKWIRKGRLRGTRTAGGHYRINPRDLQPHVAPGRLVGQATEATPSSSRTLPCWEYLSDNRVVRDKCKDCKVYQERAAGCLEAGNGQAYADRLCEGSCDECAYYRRVRGLSTNVLVISSDEPLLQRLSTGENDSIVLQTARSAYEASAAVQAFPAAFVIVDQELVATEGNRLLQALSTDPRLTGAKIVLCVPHGATTGRDTEIRGYGGGAVFGTIEKPFGLRRIAAVINSFPIELSPPTEPSKKRK